MNQELLCRKRILFEETSNECGWLVEVAIHSCWRNALRHGAATGRWKEVDYKANYLSHLNSLHDLDSHGTDKEGRDLQQIQRDLLIAAR